MFYEKIVIFASDSRVIIFFAFMLFVLFYNLNFRCFTFCMRVYFVKWSCADPEGDRPNQHSMMDQQIKQKHCQNLVGPILTKLSGSAHGGICGSWKF